MNKFENLKPLIADLPSQPALMFTEEDPFKIYLTISNLKSDTYAKDGDIVDTEILVTAGPTSLLPGPVISEFAKVKIPAGVEAGKIAVKKDTVVAKAGDKVSKDLANILRKLNIKPMKVKMNVYGIFDGAPHKLTLDVEPTDASSTKFEPIHREYDGIMAIVHNPPRTTQFVALFIMIMAWLIGLTIGAVLKRTFYN